MKKTLITLLIIALLIPLLVIVAGIIKFNYLDEPYVGDPVTYISSSGETINAHFKTDDSVTISGQAFETTSLKPSISASGERYSNADDSLIFWLKGDEAMLLKSDTVSFQGSKENSQSQPLAGSIWKYTGTIIDGELRPTADDTKIILNFDDSRFFGEAGCNSFFGSYQYSAATPQKISFTDIGSSLALCEKPIMAQEDKFLAALANSQSISIDESSLNLHFGANNQLQFKLFGSRP